MISMTVLVIHYAMSFRERTCEGKEDVTMSTFTPTSDNTQFALAAVRKQRRMLVSTAIVVLVHQLRISGQIGTLRRSWMHLRLRP